MSISMKQALFYVPQDKNWISKVLIGSFLMFFPSFAYIFPGIRRMLFDPMNYYAIAIYLMFSITIFVAISGYFYKCVHNRIIHEKHKLPSWNHLTYYLEIGAKSYIGGFVFSIPFIIFTAILWSFAPVLNSPELIPFILTSGFVHIIYSFFYTMMALNFAQKFKISAFWDIKGAWYLIKGNITNFILLVANCIVIALMHLILSVVLVNAQILSLLLPFISFYIFMVYADLFAQFALNKIEAKSEVKECKI